MERAPYMGQDYDSIAREMKVKLESMSTCAHCAIDSDESVFGELALVAPMRDDLGQASLLVGMHWSKSARGRTTLPTGRFKGQPTSRVGGRLDIDVAHGE